MNKEIFKQIAFPTLSILTAFLLYIFTNFFCYRYGCYVMLGDNRYDPLISGMLWFIPTLIILCVFGKKIIVSWLRHIAWWYVFFTPWAITHLSDNLFFSETWIANACMAVLFIITLVYAPVMHYRLKKKGS